MCNLYNVTTTQEAMIKWSRAMLEDPPSTTQKLTAGKHFHVANTHMMCMMYLSATGLRPTRWRLAMTSHAELTVETYSEGGVAEIKALVDDLRNFRAAAIKTLSALPSAAQIEREVQAEGGYTPYHMAMTSARQAAVINLSVTAIYMLVVEGENPYAHYLRRARETTLSQLRNLINVGTEADAATVELPQFVAKRLDQWMADMVSHEKMDSDNFLLGWIVSVLTGGHQVGLG